MTLRLPDLGLALVRVMSFMTVRDQPWSLPAAQGPGFTQISSLSLTSLGELGFIDDGLETQRGVTGLRSQKTSNSGSLGARLWLA